MSSAVHDRTPPVGLVQVAVGPTSEVDARAQPPCWPAVTGSPAPSSAATRNRLVRPDTFDLVVTALAVQHLDPARARWICRWGGPSAGWASDLVPGVTLRSMVRRQASPPGWPATDVPVTPHRRRLRPPSSTARDLFRVGRGIYHRARSPGVPGLGALGLAIIVAVKTGSRLPVDLGAPSSLMVVAVPVGSWATLSALGGLRDYGLAQGLRGSRLGACHGRRALCGTHRRCPGGQLPRDGRRRCGHGEPNPADHAEGRSQPLAPPGRPHFSTVIADRGPLGAGLGCIAVKLHSPDLHLNRTSPKVIATVRHRGNTVRGRSPVHG